MDWFKFLAVAAAIMTLFLGFNTLIQPAAIATTTWDSDIIVDNTVGDAKYLVSLSGDADTYDIINGIGGDIYANSSITSHAEAITYKIEGASAPTASGWVLKNFDTTYQLYKDGTQLATKTVYYTGEITTETTTELPEGKFKLSDYNIAANDRVELHIWFTFDIGFDGMTISDTTHSYDGRYILQTITISPDVDVPPPIDENGTAITTGTASITIKDGDGALMPGATAVLSGNGISLTRITAAGGVATFADIEQGTYDYTITKDGFTTYSNTITIIANQTTSITVNMAVVGSGSGSSTTTTTDYVWSDYGYIAVLGGIILAALIFALAPMPPKIRGYIAVLVSLMGIVIAHLLNTGVI